MTEANTVKCRNCVDGWREEMEGGRPVRDACYTCGNTGRVAREQDAVIRLGQMIEMLAADRVAAMRAATDSDPEGEGWAFHAAENGMSAYDYSTVRVMAETDRLGRVFKKLQDEGESALVASLLRRLVPPEEVVVKKTPPVPPSGGSPDNIPF